MVYGPKKSDISQIKNMEMISDEHTRHHKFLESFERIIQNQQCYHLYGWDFFQTFGLEWVCLIQVQHLY